MVVRRTENRWNGWAWRAVIHGTKSSCKQVASGEVQGSILGGQYCVISYSLGQSESSASLPMAQSWEEWLTHQRDVLPSRGTSLGWKMG